MSAFCVAAALVAASSYAAPLAVAPEPRAPAVEGPCNARRESVELLPKERNAGTVKVFASTDGFDLFWIELVNREEIEASRVREIPADVPGGASRPRVAPEFATFHVALMSDGALRGRPGRVLGLGARQVARGEGGVWAMAWSVLVNDTWVAHVSLVRLGDGEARLVRDVELPLGGTGHGTVVPGWDPVAKQWLIVGEERAQVPGASRGNVYARLFTGRLDDKGRWIAKPRYLSNESPGSALLSDWATPLAWTGDRFALLWAHLQDGKARVRLTELRRNAPPITHEITTGKGFSRGVARATARGYLLAWGEPMAGSDKSRMRAATFEGGKVGPILDLSHEDVSASEVDVAVAGSRAVIAWHEGWSESSQLFVAELDLDAHGRPEIREVTRKRAGQHDWVQSIVWDGCRFALAYLDGINPSAVRLELLP